MNRGMVEVELLRAMVGKGLVTITAVFEMV